jgi:tetratricopeptide (TPR) repeat protein
MKRITLMFVIAAGLVLPPGPISAQTDTFRQHKTKGLEYQKHGMLAKAIAEYRKALEDDAQDAACHNNIGLALKDMGLLNDAEAELRSAIAIKPEKPDYHYNLGIVLAKLSNLTESEKEFQKALELKADDAETMYGEAQVLMMEAKYPEARKLIEAAITIQPGNAAYQQLLGDILLRQVHTAQALAAYKKAQALSHRTEPQLVNKIEFANDLLTIQKSQTSEAGSIH